MMVAVFAAMLLALVLAWFGRSRLAEASALAALLLAVGLFLFEIYSPEYGFRMPWIQTELDRPVPADLIRSAA
jgi:hypothetical protein